MQKAAVQKASSFLDLAGFGNLAYTVKQPKPHCVHAFERCPSQSDAIKAVAVLHGWPRVVAEAAPGVVERNQNLLPQGRGM